MLPRLWLLVGSNQGTDRQTMSLIELSWTANKNWWKQEVLENEGCKSKTDENSKMKNVVTLQGPQEQGGLQERKDCRHSVRRKYTDLNMENTGFEKFTNLCRYWKMRSNITQLLENGLYQSLHFLLCTLTIEIFRKVLEVKFRFWNILVWQANPDQLDLPSL